MKSDERTRLLVRDEERDDTHGQATLLTIPSTTTVTNASTPLPWCPLLVLLALKAMQPLAFEVIFPFVNQMILETGVVTDPERVGFYSGLIESIFACVSFITILPCSALTDRVGRKPVILVGSLGLAVSVACFGMSKTFPAMVISRCMAGALGSVGVCTKIVIGEMTDKSNQAIAFTASTIAYRTGQVAGLPLGGLLAHPERHFSFFRTPFWIEYPFALPCFAASAFCLFAVILGYFCLQETLRRNGKHIVDERTYSSTDSTTGVESFQQSTARISHEEANPPKKGKYKSLLTSSILSVFISNVALCMSSEALFSVFPLFAFTPIDSGGLGESEAAIGTQMGIRAVMQIGVMVFFPFLQRRIGTVRMYQISMWTWPVSVLCFPLLHMLVRQDGTSGLLFMLAFFVFGLIWSTGALGWTAITIMVTDCTPSAEALATMNGVSQMVRALPQAVAPVFINSMFAASIKSGIAGGNLIWIVLFIITTSAAMHSMTLREPKTDWRQR